LDFSDRRGYNIGVRIIDEYFAKSGAGRCTDFRDAAEAMSKVRCLSFEKVHEEWVDLTGDSYRWASRCFWA
jgi:hypothetical protein